jgi:hypothetical protein
LEIKAAEAEEAKRLALDAETAAARRRAVIGLGGKTQWQDGVADALLKVAQRSDEGWIVTLEIASANSAAINLLRSEPCTPAEVAGKLPDKSPCYVFYSFPTPPPPKPVRQTTAPAAPAVARNTFQATAGGARNVEVSNAPLYNAEEKKDEEEKEAKDEDEEKKDEDENKDDEETEQNGEEANGDDEQPNVSGLDLSSEPAPVTPLEEPTPARSPSPVPETKGRVLFIYWCPPGSPVRFRMVYSTTVRGIQQDAVDKAGIEIVGKMETSDKSDLAEHHIREEIPTKPRSSASLPIPATSRVFGAPAPGSKAPVFGAPAPARGVPLPSGGAPVFGAPAPAGFGRPRPVHSSSTSSAVESPASASTPVDDDADNKDRIRNAFDAFGPRVTNTGGGFARPRPAGRR